MAKMHDQILSKVISNSSLTMSHDGPQTPGKEGLLLIVDVTVLEAPCMNSMHAILMSYDIDKSMQACSAKFQTDFHNSKCN